MLGLATQKAAGSSFAPFHRGILYFWKRNILLRFGPLMIRLALFLLPVGKVLSAPMDDATPLRMPSIGDNQIRVLTSNLLELTLITTKPPDPATVTNWNFVDANGNFTPPATSQFFVTVNSQNVSVASVGFRRRVLYAPLTHRDLRIANYLYLQLASPVATGSVVQVQNPSQALWSSNLLFTTTTDPLRFNPAIHVNQIGYLPNMPKKAMIGYFLGSFGEMNIPAGSGFQLVNIQSSNIVFTGTLVPRPDVGYSYSPTPYQKVLEANFSSFQTPGEYRLVVPDLGASLPFIIDSAVAGSLARTYELGIYHQRCGTNNGFPYTRFIHGACHTNRAQIPTMASPEFNFVNQILNSESMSALGNPRHTAPRMTNVNASLYPFTNSGTVDISGGHHDAGDYSKYTINVAGLIHYLTFAVDAFPDVKDLDNLGIPESGDGISDLIQEAKWEADFLCKLQDLDGGFYFIVYPKNRQYESNVLPENGDPQVVLPKNTSGTAAATAALAELASSPVFKTNYPVTASNYLARAKAGWDFLQRAITNYGRDGSYQMVTQYGDNFMHDDELAWAAAALFAATGEPAYDLNLRTNTPNPNDPTLRRWGWWSLYEGYGCAYRTYAFAARTGRLQTNQLDAAYLAKCEAEIKHAATNAVTWSEHNGYGSSFSDENKPIRTAGWYFSGDQTFDLTTAYLIDPQTNYLDVILKNFNYELGCNPVNITYLTGLGWKRQREIVHQYAQNDYRTLPPSGIPLGNIQEGFYWVSTYGTELGKLSYLLDGANTAPYPVYDRWGDAFNVLTEFVVSRQSGKMVSSAAWLMAMTNLKTQAWNSATATITGVPGSTQTDQIQTNNLSAPGLDLSNARIVWEALGQEPYVGSSFRFTPGNIGNNWVEAEAQLPDGRRVFAATNFFATMPGGPLPLLITNAEMVALFHLNTNFSDATGRHTDLVASGSAAFDPIGLRVLTYGDKVNINLPGTNVFTPGQTRAVSIEASLYINNYNPLGLGPANILSLERNWDAHLTLSQDTWRALPDIIGGSQIILFGSNFVNSLSLKQWHQVNLTINKSGYQVAIDGKQIISNTSGDLTKWSNAGGVVLQAGNFDGWMRNLVVRNIRTVNPPQITNLMPLPNNNFQFSFTGTNSIAYNVLASTNLTNWTIIGRATQMSPASFQFLDAGATNLPIRFYRLSIP